MHRILIVDDEESIRFAMGEYFEVQGYHVDCAQSFEEADALLAKGPYLVVIVDLRLTGTSNLGGLDVVRSARERYPDTRVIVLSAYRSPEIEAEVGRHGVGAFLRKPKPLPDLAQIMFGMIGTGCRTLSSP